MTEILNFDTNFQFWHRFSILIQILNFEAIFVMNRFFLKMIENCKPHLDKNHWSPFDRKFRITFWLSNFSVPKLLKIRFLLFFYKICLKKLLTSKFSCKVTGQQFVPVVGFDPRHRALRLIREDSGLIPFLQPKTKFHLGGTPVTFSILHTYNLIISSPHRELL